MEEGTCFYVGKGAIGWIEKDKESVLVGLYKIFSLDRCKKKFQQTLLLDLKK